MRPMAINLANAARTMSAVLVATILVVVPQAMARAEDPLQCGGKDATIVGTEGDDVIRAVGAEIIVGLGGNDDISLADATQARICGGPGHDTIVLSGEWSWASGGEGEDTITALGRYARAQGDDGNDVLLGGGPDSSLFGGNGDDTITATRKGAEASGGDGNDTIRLEVRAKAFGGRGNDTIFGSPDSDMIQGGGGDDTIRAGAGRDTVWGDGERYGIIDDPGNDRINGGFGRDHLYGGDGDDRLVGEQGSDRLIGGNGADIMIGGPGNDVITMGYSPHANVAKGGAGDDHIFAEPAPEAPVSLIRGGPGKDSIYIRRHVKAFGNGGADTIEIKGGAGVVRAGIGSDTVIYSDAGEFRVELGPGNDHLYPLQQNFRASSIVANGGRGSDFLFGEQSDDRLNGGPGNDYIEAWRGDDVVKGGEDHDEIHGGWGSDQIDGGPGNDLCHPGRFALADGGVAIGGSNPGDTSQGCAGERTLPIGLWEITWYDAAPDWLIRYYGQRTEIESHEYLDADLLPEGESRSFEQYKLTGLLETAADRCVSKFDC